MEPTQRMQRLWRQGLPPRVREASRAGVWAISGWFGFGGGACKLRHVQMLDFHALKLFDRDRLCGQWQLEMQLP